MSGDTCAALRVDVTPQEVKLQGQDSSFLSAEYRDVLENSEKYDMLRTLLYTHSRVVVTAPLRLLSLLLRRSRYQKEFKNQPRALEMLFGLVTDLFVDKHKFKGHNVQHLLPQLVMLLQRYDFDAVLSFIMAPPMA